MPLSLTNSVGVPATFYFCLTLEAEMVKSIASLPPAAHTHQCRDYARGIKGAPPPGSVRSLLDWAKRNNGIAPEQLNDFFRRTVQLFTELYAQKPHPKTGAPPTACSLPSACRLLREVPLAGSAYPSGVWDKSVDIFDFSGKRRM